MQLPCCSGIQLALTCMWDLSPMYISGTCLALCVAAEVQTALTEQQKDSKDSQPGATPDRWAM